MNSQINFSRYALSQRGGSPKEPLRLIKQICFAAFALSAVSNALAAPLVEAFKSPHWASYVFISTTMPQESLVRIAREAVKTRSILVLRGLEPATSSLEQTRTFTARLIQSCCEGKQVSVLIHPKLFDTYQVKTTPSFVVAFGEDANPASFSKVSGDMSIANALKFIAQESREPRVRAQAAEIYKKSFSEI